MELRVDIVIPTLLKEPELLKKCLESLQHSELKIEEKTLLKPHVYVVCNTTTQVVDECFPHLDLAHFPFEIEFVVLGQNTGFAKAMNEGIKKGSSEYIYALNDDTQVEKSWLKELFLRHQETKADMVASRIFLADKETLDSQGFTFAWRGKAEALKEDFSSSLSDFPDHWLKNKKFLFKKNLPDVFFQEPFGPDAAGCLYTRALLAKTGGFDESFFAYLEDVDLALRARQKGMYCVLAKRAILYHYKHATSSTFHIFKQKRDFANWWRIVSQRYSAMVWLKFFKLIFLERMRNFNGVRKAKQQ